MNCIKTNLAHKLPILNIYLNKNKNLTFQTLGVLDDQLLYYLAIYKLIQQLFYDLLHRHQLHQLHRM